MLKFISTYWTMLVTIVGWIIILVKDHIAISDIKHDVKFLQENVDVREIELIKKSYDGLEAKYDKLSNESRQLRSAKSFKGKIKKRSTSMLNNINYFDNNDNEANTAEPIRRLKLKIKNLEEKIKGNEVNNE